MIEFFSALTVVAFFFASLFCVGYMYAEAAREGSSVGTALITLFAVALVAALIFTVWRFSA